MVYSFLNDYSEGCHPSILKIMAETNVRQEMGYGEDSLCVGAADLVRRATGLDNADVHFLSGATQANKIIIASALRPFEAVVAAKTGHIAVHEAGAIEATGHKICTVETADGKLTPGLVDAVVRFHSDEHMVKPRMVYISNTTEIGSVYTKTELESLSVYCRDNGLYLFMDGARLAQALTSPASDISLKELAGLVDVFYLGGTKNGALLGEAVVINNGELKTGFRHNLKQNGALLAKGRILGAQFMGLLADDLYFENGRHANRMALKLADGIANMGFCFLSAPVSNQIFPILPNSLIDKLSLDFGFYVWSTSSNDTSSIRLVTSWATTEQAVVTFLLKLKSLI